MWTLWRDYGAEPFLPYLPYLSVEFLVAGACLPFHEVRPEHRKLIQEALDRKCRQMDAEQDRNKINP